MSVSIIIPTLITHPQQLHDCIISLSKQTYQSFELLVVANCSLTTSQQFQKKHPLPVKCRWIVLNSNQGFAPAVNRGIEHSKHQLIALLNDDVIVDQLWLEQLTITQQRTKAEMVASTIYHAGSKVLDSQGFTFLLRGQAPAIAKNKTKYHQCSDYWLNNPSYFPCKQLSEPFGPDAAACLYTKNMLDKLSLFNESFFAYLEDVDLAFRARINGFQCVLANQAIAYHHKHQTSQQFWGFKKRKDVINWYRIIQQYPPGLVKRFWPLIIKERVKNIKGLFF